jgi:hypothetical protein
VELWLLVVGAVILGVAVTVSRGTRGARPDVVEEAGLAHSASATPAGSDLAESSLPQVEEGLEGAWALWTEIFVERVLELSTPPSRLRQAEQAVRASGDSGLVPVLAALVARRSDAAVAALESLEGRSLSPLEEGIRQVVRGQLAVHEGKLTEAAELFRAVEGGLSVTGPARQGELLVDLVRVRVQPNPRAVERLATSGLELLRASPTRAGLKAFSGAWRFSGRFLGLVVTPRRTPALLSAVSQAAKELEALASADDADAAVWAAYGDASLLVWLLVEQEPARLEAARGALERAATQDPQACGTQLSIGLLHLLKGSHDEAVQDEARRAATAALARAKALSPDAPELRELQLSLGNLGG